jgi:D-beta-D-heptose 7-phosphate kinase/D-beta-D-heptose 1-phosphate adenosyltransferase
MDLQLSDQPSPEVISPGAASSIVYHDIFDYPLTLTELIKWEAGVTFAPDIAIGSKNGYFFIASKEGQVLKRLMRKRISARKYEIAKRAGSLLGIIPWIRLVGITGALAMENADEAADIDLLIITRRGTLWLSRLLALFILMAVGFPTRRFGQKDQKDKLCLNMWLDESDIAWPAKDRNPYTAHEIAQIVPLVNKKKTFESFIFANRWLKGFWPNAVMVNTKTKLKTKKPNAVIQFLEALAYLAQLKYMNSKITREVVTPTRAIFHPHDWGVLVRTRLEGLGFGS